MGEEDEGDEGQEDAYCLKSSLDVPFRVVLLQPATSLGGEERSHGGRLKDEDDGDRPKGTVSRRKGREGSSLHSRKVPP